jgi:hypothetical protein
MDEEKLASPDFQPAMTSMAASAAITEAAKTMTGWQRKLMNFFVVIIFIATGAGLIGQLTSIGKIPDCDAQQTRDTLSDLNKANKFNASKYNFIKSVSTSDTETTCTANLALWGGGTVEYDYRIFKDKDDSQIKHYFGRIWRLIGETGFPNQIFNDSWMVGFWRADHGGHEVEVGRRAWTLAKAIPGSLRPQGTAADVSALYLGIDWTG